MTQTEHGPVKSDSTDHGVAHNSWTVIIQHKTQHSTAQHSTAQHSTEHRSAYYRATYS